MKSIVVCGDAVAAAIALVLDRVLGISGTYRVMHLPSSASISSQSLASCAILLRQEPYENTIPDSTIPADCTRITFPSLELRSLWPFNCANPYNRPEPPRYPSGRFPYGDSFILSCLEKGIDPKHILDCYLGIEWAVSWPDLENLQKEDRERLDALDARCDVRIATFVHENLQHERLFWAAHAPTNKLLCELIVRLLDRTFAPKKLVSRRVLTELLHRVGAEDLFGAIGVPIHPHVARHFSLQWYDAQQRYAFFGERLTYDEYFKRMIREARPKIAP